MQALRLGAERGVVQAAERETELDAVQPCVLTEALAGGLLREGQPWVQALLLGVDRGVVQAAEQETELDAVQACVLTEALAGEEEQEAELRPVQAHAWVAGQNAELDAVLAHALAGEEEPEAELSPVETHFWIAGQDAELDAVPAHMPAAALEADLGSVLAADAMEADLGTVVAAGQEGAGQRAGPVHPRGAVREAVQKPVVRILQVAVQSAVLRQHLPGVRKQDAHGAQRMLSEAWQHELPAPRSVYQAAFAVHQRSAQQAWLTTQRLLMAQTDGQVFPSPLWKQGGAHALQLLVVPVLTSVPAALTGPGSEQMSVQMSVQDGVRTPLLGAVLVQLALAWLC